MEFHNLHLPLFHPSSIFPSLHLFSLLYFHFSLSYFDLTSSSLMVSNAANVTKYITSSISPHVVKVGGSWRYLRRSSLYEVFFFSRYFFHFFFLQINRMVPLYSHLNIVFNCNQKCKLVSLFFKIAI